MTRFSDNFYFLRKNKMFNIHELLIFNYFHEFAHFDHFVNFHNFTNLRICSVLMISE